MRRADSMLGIALMLGGMFLFSAVDAISKVLVEDCVVSGASDGAISLELDGGKSVLLTEIKRFGM